LNAPGFFAVIYFDSPTGTFRMLTAPGDYNIATKFHIYTTTGHLQLVNPGAAAFSHTDSMGYKQKANALHSNVMYMANTTSATHFHGQIDCETTSGNLYGSLDCAEKGDLLMFINTQVNGAGFLMNPEYPNIYTVEKIFRQEKTYDTDPSNPNSEIIRNQIHLDYGLNTAYVWGKANNEPYALAAAIYKFYPPTDGGYNYVGACSNRGICDTSIGQCTCFPGYTTDNCGSQNALAL